MFWIIIYKQTFFNYEILFFNFKAIKGVEKIADEEEKRIASEINNSITNKFKNEKFNTEAAQSTQKPIRWVLKVENEARSARLQHFRSKLPFTLIFTTSALLNFKIIFLKLMKFDSLSDERYLISEIRWSLTEILNSSFLF